MSDLKEFLERNKVKGYSVSGDLYHRDDLGLFFWERGGKQFIKLLQEKVTKDLIIICLLLMKWKNVNNLVNIG